MSLWQEFFREPIIFLSFTGLALVVGLCFFYAVYFMIKVSRSDENSA